MSSIKVSALAAKTSPAGPDVLLINDGGTSKKITIANLPDTDTTYSAGTGITLAGTTFSASPVALTTIQTAANQVAQLALTAQEGDVVVRSDENKTYMHNGGTAASMADYTLMATPTDAVTSVDGDTGTVTLSHDTLADYVANEHIDWTADQGGTNLHAGNYTDTNTTYSVGDGGLTSNDFTDDDHTKLNAIEASADVTDSTNVVAALTAGTNVTISAGGTIASTDTNTVYTHPNHSGDVVSTADGATVIQVDAVDIAMLSATGTASSTTFLRGDNTWVTPTDTDTNTTYTASTGMSLAGTAFSCTIDSPSEVGLGNLSSSGNNLSGSFTATGNITAYSDLRLKSNIEVIDDALAKVMSLRGVTFDMNEERSTGVIAQELETVLPEAVRDNDVSGMKSVAYGNIVGLLVEAIKELSAKVEQLENR